MAKPVLLTREIRARDAAAKWKRYRSCNGDWTLYRRDLEKLIYEGLVALGPDPRPDDVDRIIGNGTWTSTGRCYGCGLDDEGPRVVVGEDPDHGSSTATLCVGCLKEALALVTSATATEGDHG